MTVETAEDWRHLHLSVARIRRRTLWQVLPVVTCVAIACTPSPTVAVEAERGVVEVLYGEGESANSQAMALHQKLADLGATTFSNFPYVARANGHTFVYFSQLKTGRHGGGSVPVIAIRPSGTTTWSYYVLFDADGTVNEKVLRTIRDLGVTRDGPLFLREYRFSGDHDVKVEKLEQPPDKLRAWGPVQYAAGQSRHVRTAYKEGESWLVESTGSSLKWAVGATATGEHCEPIARQAGRSFSEAARRSLVGPHT